MNVTQSGVSEFGGFAEYHGIPGCCLFNLISGHGIMILESPGLPKVTYPNITAIVNKDIGWFEVTVHDAGGVHVVHSTQYVVDDDQDMVFLYPVFAMILNHFAYIGPKVFLDKEQLVEYNIWFFLCLLDNRVILNVLRVI